MVLYLVGEDIYCFLVVVVIDCKCEVGFVFDVLVLDDYVDVDVCIGYWVEDLICDVWFVGYVYYSNVCFVVLECDVGNDCFFYGFVFFKSNQGV